MNSQQSKPQVRWWRPRFSIRVLLILMTLVCAYLAGRGLTRGQGVKDVLNRVDNDRDAEFDPLNLSSNCPADASSICPLLIEIRVAEARYKKGNYVFSEHRRFYFWCFGYVAKLPYEKSKTTVTLPSWWTDLTQLR